jgi:hypothetical protein
VTEVWALPGYDVQALIGYGATGEVWRARELATGEAVALKRLRAGADPGAVASLRREASVLRSLDTPYVVRLRAVHGDGDDTVLVLDLAPGGSLAALLTRRGHLDAGEVVTIAAPLAQALAAAHACGLVHGDVTPANVLFTADGMPLLADLGLARLSGTASAGDAVDGTAEYVDPAVAAGGQPDEAADVWALAAVCHSMLSGTPPHEGESVQGVLDAARAGSRAPLGLLAPTAPRALVAAIERGLERDPALRPDALAFASALRRSHAAAPVRLRAVLPDAVPVAEADLRPTHRVREAAPVAPEPVRGADGRRRRAVAFGAAIGLLAVAALVGWLTGRTGSVQLASVEAATRVPPRATPSAPNWQAVLDELDRTRADALAAADVAALSAVYAPGSRLLLADHETVQRLATAGQRATGVRHTLRQVVVTSQDARSAVLQVVDELSAYEVVDRAGVVVSRGAARAAATFVVRLVRTGGGWRLMDVTPA